MFNKSCRWLDSNSGPLVLEATALPTAPQPLPNYSLSPRNFSLSAQIQWISACPSRVHTCDLMLVQVFTKSTWRRKKMKDRKLFYWIQLWTKLRDLAVKVKACALLPFKKFLCCHFEFWVSKSFSLNPNTFISFLSTTLKQRIKRFQFCSIHFGNKKVSIYTCVLSSQNSKRR